jgi:phage terminase small subunit
MTPKQRLFVLEYIKDFNATQAAIRAGYSPKYAGTNCDKLLKNTKISAAIDEEFQKRAMSANEVLSRMGDIARSSAEDYLDVDKGGYARINLGRMKEEGKLHLVKKYKVTKQGGIEVELYDAQAALVQMGKQHGLFPNRQELTGKDGKDLSISLNWGDNADA